jgi:hypothetical protein
MRISTGLVSLGAVFSLGFLAGCESDAQQEVAGVVRVAEGISFKIQESDALFITARTPGAEGPPLAVLKMLGVKFPVSFAIGQPDVMMPGTWFRGPVEIRAILRRSGFINIPTSADLVGQHAAPVNPGVRGVDIELKRAP